MRLTILATILLAAGLIGGIGFYLHVDDLADCDAQPTVTISSCQAADAIVAVSGGDTAARTREAVELYKNGWGTKLIFSGAAQDKSGPSNAEAMRRIALSSGVPNADIITEEYGATTKENAENTQDILARYEIESVILVTSGYHQRRASLEFSARSNRTVSVRSHSVANDNQWSSSWWWLTPTGWYLAISELVKISFFYIGATR